MTEKLNFARIAEMLQSYADCIKTAGNLEAWHYIPEVEEMAARIRALESASQPGGGEAEDWVSITQIHPRPGQQVLATYINCAGKPRVIRARYVAAKTVEAYTDADDTCCEYDEATDTYYLQRGWYEQIDNWGDYSAVQVCEGEITHWMPMPAAPSAGNGEAKGDGNG